MVEMVDEIIFQERIYDLVNGYLDLENFPVPESEFEKNEFVRGSVCGEAYGRVTDAYERLCQRLQADGCEDADVEIIINEMNTIMKHISLQMFRYGVLFARRENMNP